MERLSCSASFKDVRNPIKLSSGCSKELYLMRQKYLRSYPLLMTTTEKQKLGENAISRMKKWLKEMKRKYNCRYDDQENKRKTWPPREDAGRDEVEKSFYSYVETLKLTVCMPKVDADKKEDTKTIGWGK